MMLNTEIGQGAEHKATMYNSHTSTECLYRTHALKAQWSFWKMGWKY